MFIAKQVWSNPGKMETILQMAKLQNSDALHKVQGMFPLKIKGTQVWNLWSI